MHRLADRTHTMSRLDAQAARKEMSWRARTYLSIASFRHLCIGLTLLLMGHGSQGSTLFHFLFLSIPRLLWAYILLVGGVHLAYSAIRGSERHARIALVLSTGLSCMWATAFLSVLFKSPVSILGAVIFLALAGKDLTMCAQPLRSPFEPLIELYRDQR